MPSDHWATSVLHPPFVCPLLYSSTFLCFTEQAHSSFHPLNHPVRSYWWPSTPSINRPATACKTGSRSVAEASGRHIPHSLSTLIHSSESTKPTYLPHKGPYTSEHLPYFALNKVLVAPGNLAICKRLLQLSVHLTFPPHLKHTCERLPKPYAGPPS